MLQENIDYYINAEGNFVFTKDITLSVVSAVKINVCTARGITVSKNKVNK